MTPIEIEIQVIAIVVSVACALPGVFLVLRRMALMSDAITHTVLLGIVLAFFIVESLSSPLLLFGAAAMGVLTITLVEAVRRTGLVREDASIGLVFPALFSIAVILIARFAGNVHLDTDAVLLGELAFAPFRRLRPGGIDLGPRALWVMGGILLFDLLFIIVFFKELKITTFDPALATALGFSPIVMHYAFMSIVSITAVGAFDAVGSVLVVALMIAPPAAAYLLSDRLWVVLLLSALFAALAALTGFWAAWLADASIAGSMATMAGIFFLLAFLLAPERGVVAGARRRARQRIAFAQLMLAIHLFNHEDTPEAEEESRVEHLGRHLRWRPDFARRIVRRAVAADWVQRVNGRLGLTDRGRDAARTALAG
jgi:manganese/zinc/iron transport system permease protein